jgi:hypothetical protein
MPVMLSKDKLGNFARWGNRGKKYYYIPNNKISREKAKALAFKQGRAIKISQRK